MKRLALALMIAFGGVAVAEPESTAPTFEFNPGERPHEILHGGPSGMWTSNIPVGNSHAYRWRLLAIGGVIAGSMGFLMWHLIKKANAVPRATIVRAASSPASARRAPSRSSPAAASGPGSSPSAP
jgi:hypothetical protein